MIIPTIMKHVFRDKDYSKLVKRPIELFERDGVLRCADYEAIDYYGEGRNGIPHICKSLEQYAAKRGGYWEWENPECISFYK